MGEALGLQSAKAKMSEVLAHGGNRTFPAPVGDVVDLIVDANSIRSDGNEVAHSATSEDISLAVDSMPFGKDRGISEYLRTLLDSEENE